ncbi:sensor histidine kinase [Zoogloea sp.]|uniref:sensor histidine kinase n=1 Tax=Zoogloea sp. TaxID=49181 RepID=UPI0035B46473
MLRELLANLVDNAIRYLPCGGRITVRCGVGPGGGACIEVEDDGPGIPESARAGIFERFRRGGDAAAPGSGLGLAIVREVADRHDATLTLSDGAAGRGALFHLEFPASQN